MNDVELRRRADLLARHDFGYFTERVFGVVSPGDRYEHNWHIDAIAEYLKGLENLDIRRLVINMPPRFMKLLSDDTPVLTPSGWKSHGELQVGDEVFGSDGKAVRVDEISQKGWADFEVEFSNGEIICCNQAHLWTVYDRGAAKWRTMETQEIFATKYYSGGRSRFQLPDVDCLDFPYQNVTLDPYFLGCWLGDGSASKPCITHHQNDKEHIAAIKYKVSTVCPHTVNKHVLTTYFSKNGIIEELRKYNLFNNKHIPNEFKFNSVEIRLQVLAGLIDTDGTVNKDGRVTVSGTNKKLMMDTFEIASSLGFRPYIHIRKTLGYKEKGGGNDVYIIGFNPTLKIPTQIPRKKINKICHVRRKIGIIGVYRAEKPKIGNCIKVANEDGIYLAGWRNIPTHNSITCSIAFPAWLLGHDPSEQIVVASYAKQLALELSVKTRDVLRSDWYQRIFPETVLRSDQDEKGKFMTTLNGQRFSTSVGGTLTGIGGNYIIVDDPLNPEQAASDVERKSANEWVRSTLFTRTNNEAKSRILVVMQRLHDADVSGMLLENGKWEHLNLPVLFKERKTISIGSIGRKKWEVEAGEPLDKKRWGLSAIENRKADMTPFMFSAQYMQEPVPDEGAFFEKDWWQIYEPHELPPRESLKFYGASDFAVSEDEGDYTVHTVIGVDALDNWWVMEWYREKVDSLTWAQAEVDLMKDYKPLEWLEEAGVIFKSVDPLLRKIMEADGVYCYRRAVPSVTDKQTRAQALRGQAARRKIFLPKMSAHTTAFLNEAGRFPAGKHDDMVDSLGLFARMMPILRKGSPQVEKKSLQEQPTMITFGEAMRQHKRIMRAKRANQLEGGV